MPFEGDMKLPCGRPRHCGRAGCRHASPCPALFAAGSEAQPYRPTGAPVRELPAADDLVYLYDGSLPGFFCCVFESVYQKEIPCEIYPEGQAQPCLFRQKLIETDADKARRVCDSIPAKISPYALEQIEATFLSCLDQKEVAMLRYLLLGYKNGGRIASMFGHADVKPVQDAVKHLGGEAHLLKGFVRFSDYDGYLAATITPKNFVLPYLAGHFSSRYSGENFMIYDKTHKAALIYENRQTRIVPLEDITFPEADETELRYRAMWKQFYNTIAIKARENPKCRMTHMPKRYWENMLEVQDLLKT